MTVRFSTRSRVQLQMPGSVFSWLYSGDVSLGLYNIIWILYSHRFIFLTIVYYKKIFLTFSNTTLGSRIISLTVDGLPSSSNLSIPVRIVLENTAVCTVESLLCHLRDRYCYHRRRHQHRGSRHQCRRHLCHHRHR